MLKQLLKKISFSFSVVALAVLALLVVQTPMPAVGATIPISVGVFQTSLQNSILSSDTSMTLVSGTNKAGNALSGYTCFNVDEGTSLEEFVCGTASGTSVTSLIRGIDPVDGDLEVAALKKSHRRGASVKITDYPAIGILSRILNGVETLPNALNYAGATTCANAADLCPKSYVDGVAVAGAPNASTTVKGISEEATQAEIDASTAAGGTAARLFVNPSTLATSIYGTRLPTANEKAALVGTSGAASTSNKYVTDADTSATGSGSKVVRGTSGKIDSSWLDTTTLTTVGTYTFGESISAGAPVYLKASDGRVYNANDSIGNETTYNYLGIAQEAGTVGQVKKVATVDGTVITGLSLGSATSTVTETADVAFNPANSAADQVYTGNSSERYLFKTGPYTTNLTKIDIKISQQGTGAGITTMTVYPVTMGAGNFSLGSALPNTAVVNSPTAGATNTFTFSSPNTVTPNTFYAFVLTAASGSGANYWQVHVNSSGTAYPYGKETSGGASFSWATTAYMTTYYTTKLNYTIGDNIYLGSTGTLSLIPTSMSLGTILSSSSIVMRTSHYDKNIGSQTITFASGVGVFAIPRNATRIFISLLGTNPKKILDVKIGDVIASQSIIDYDSGASTTFTASSVNSYGLVGTSATSGTAYFYK